jgi:hypothetical protein
MVTNRMTPPEEASLAMASEMDLATHASASSRVMSSFHVLSHHP